VQLADQAIEGVLVDFFVTGSECTHWALADDVNTSYDSLHFIGEGDDLTVLDEPGVELWHGVIKCDRESGWQCYPMNPKHGQPCALVRWIHWHQEGFVPDDWARYFIRPCGEPLRGILLKAHAEIPR